MSADQEKNINISKPSDFDELLISEHLKCPLTGDLMIDPVGTPYGHFYDRWAIDAWLDSGHATDPLTRKPLYKKDYIKFYPLNDAVKSAAYAKIRKKIINSRNAESVKQLLLRIKQMNRIEPLYTPINYYEKITCDSYLKGIYVSQNILDDFLRDISFEGQNALNKKLSNLNRLFCELNNVEKSVAFHNKLLARKYKKEYLIFKADLLLLPREITYALLNNVYSARLNLQRIGVSFIAKGNRLICNLKHFSKDIKNGQLDKKILKAIFENKDNFFITCKRLGLNINSFIQNKTINVDKKIDFINHSRLVESICQDINNNDFLTYLKKVVATCCHDDDMIESLINICVAYQRNKRIITHLIDRGHRKTSTVNNEKKNTNTTQCNETKTSSSPPFEQSDPPSSNPITAFIKDYKTCLSRTSITFGIGLLGYSSYQFSKAYEDIHEVKLFDSNTSLTILGVSLFLIGVAIAYRYQNTTDNEEVSNRNLMVNQ